MIGIRSLPLATKWNPIAIQRSLKGIKSEQISKLAHCQLAHYKYLFKSLSQAHQKIYQKWNRYQLSTQFFLKYPKFCEYLETTGLLSQIKVTKYPPKEINGEPALLVDGHYLSWKEIEENFECLLSKNYKERFLIHKCTREVYTYLDNGKGLQPHHPFLTEKNPISKLTDEDYQKTLSKAHAFVRPGEENLSQEERQALNEKRIYILQAVTSYIDGPNTRAHQFLSRAVHPYLRLIIGNDNQEANVSKGEVYEVGFLKSKVMMTIPLMTTAGLFRSPDIWEYVNCQEKIVTNVPITEEESKALYWYTIKYHRNAINIGNVPAFHLGKQNCTTYMRMAFAAVGITVPTEITLTQLIQKIAPEWSLKACQGISSFCQTLQTPFKHIVRKLPKVLQHPIDAISTKVTLLITTAIKVMAALSLVPMHTALGGGLGRGGEAFVPIGYPQKRIEPSLLNWKHWFKLSRHRFNLPGVFQEWQRKQPSTVVYDHPVRLTIVP